MINLSALLVTLLTLLILPNLNAQIIVPDNFTVQTDAVSLIIKSIQESHLTEADTNEDGIISNAEVLEWNSRKRQDVFNVFTVRAILRAESEERNLLPQAYQDVLDELDTTKAALSVLRQSLCPGCTFPEP